MRRMILALLAGCLLASGCAQDGATGYTIVFDGIPAVYDEQIYDGGRSVGRIVQQEISRAGQARMVASFEADWLRGANENIVFYPRHGRLQVEHLQRHGAPLSEGAVLCGFTSGNRLIWFNVKTLISDRGAEARKKARDLQARFATP